MAEGTPLRRWRLTPSAIETVEDFLVACEDLLNKLPGTNPEGPSAEIRRLVDDVSGHISDVLES